MVIERATHLCTTSPSDLQAEAENEPDIFWKNVTLGMAHYLEKLRDQHHLGILQPGSVTSLMSLDPDKIKAAGMSQEDTLTLQIYFLGVLPGGKIISGGLPAIIRAQQRAAREQNSKIPEESIMLTTMVENIQAARKAHSLMKSKNKLA